MVRQVNKKFMHYSISHREHYSGTLSQVLLFAWSLFTEHVGCNCIMRDGRMKTWKNFHMYLPMESTLDLFM